MADLLDIYSLAFDIYHFQLEKEEYEEKEEPKKAIPHFIDQLRKFINA